jgi:hypothetical protein
MLTGEQVKKQRAQTRERTRRWRLRLAEARLPDGRQLDHVIADAFMKVWRERGGEGKDAEAVQRVVSLVAVATGRALGRRGFHIKGTSLRNLIIRRIAAAK